MAANSSHEVTTSSDILHVSSRLAKCSLPRLGGRAVSSFLHSPLGESRPEGPERGSPPRRTLRIGFAEEPWANARRLI